MVIYRPHHAAWSQAQVTLDTLTKAVLAQFKGKASDDVIRVCTLSLAHGALTHRLQSIMLYVIEHKGGNVTSDSWDLFMRRFGPFAESISKVHLCASSSPVLIAVRCIHQCAQSLYDRSVSKRAQLPNRIGAEFWSRTLWNWICSSGQLAPWFHGGLARTEVEPMLTKPGMFLIRYSEKFPVRSEIAIQSGRLFDLRAIRD